MTKLCEGDEIEIWVQREKGQMWISKCQRKLDYAFKNK